LLPYALTILTSGTLLFWILIAYIMLPSGAARLLMLAMILFLREFSTTGILS